LRLAARVHDVAAVHPDGRAMLVKVIAGPYEQWPLPWYVRDLTRVGYWTQPEDAGPLDAAPVVVAAQEHAAAVEAALGDRYVSEFYGLRPGVLLSVFIERGLWERFLETRQ
jgi:predicted membrane-bound mannosyltransferase